MRLYPPHSKSPPVRTSDVERGRPRAQSRWVFPGPIRVIVSMWIVLFLNFFLGPNEYPFPSINTILLIAAAIGIFCAGGVIGTSFQRTGEGSRAIEAGGAGKGWQTIATYGSLISAAGAITSVLLNLKSGKSIDMVVYNAEMVRQQSTDDLGGASIVSNAVGFLSYSWLIITIFLCRFRGGIRNNKLAVLGSGTGVGCVLMLYFINVNRTAFLELLLFLVLYVGVVGHGRWREMFRRLNAQAKVAVAVVVLLCCSYIFFIAMARADRGENERFVEGYMTLKYRIGIFENWNYDLTCALYKLQWYGSHQIRNLDQILSKGDIPLLRFDGRLFFSWPIKQVARFSPSLKTTTMEASDELASTMIRSGANEWQWCTALLVFCHDFGILGGLVLVFAIGLLIGFSYSSFLTYGSLASVLVCFWWGSVAILLFINYPIDNFIQTNLCLVLVLKLYFLMIGRNSV